MSYQAHNMLVTGGAGFIGSNFVHHVLRRKQPCNVVNLDLLTYAGSPENLSKWEGHEDYRFVKGNIRDKTLVGDLLREYHIDTIVHFAAESHVDRSIESPDSFIHTNIVGTYELLEAARRYWLDSEEMAGDRCRFHHVSTDEVYGSLNQDDAPFREDNPYTPNSPYSASKAASDHLVRAYAHTYGLPVTISSCSNNYGPYQHSEKLIPTIIGNCMKGETIPIYGDGTNIRDWLYVEDHCAAISCILSDGVIGETYCIGGETERSNNDIARTICEIMDDVAPRDHPHQQLVEFVKDRPGHDWRYAMDIAKIRQDLDWTPKESMESGLRKTVDWYLNK